jgi:hypothetical protein
MAYAGQILENPVSGERIVGTSYPGAGEEVA